MEVDFILVGKRIKEIRSAKGFSQVELANILNCDPCYVSKLESGNKKMSVSRIVAVADALCVSVDEILGRERPDQTQDELSIILSDCTPAERQLIIGAIRGIKQALREKTVSRKG